MVSLQGDPLSFTGYVGLIIEKAHFDEEIVLWPMLLGRRKIAEEFERTPTDR